MPAPDADRRQHERKILWGSAQIAFPGLAPLVVRTIDIGAGGMGIVAPANPTLKVRCLIRFSLPLHPKGSYPVELKAMVVRSVFSSSKGGFIVGLQFLDIPDDASTLIERFLHN